MAEDGSVKLDTNKIHTIAWSDKPLNRTSFSGCLAYGGINLPQLDYSYATVVPANYEIVTVNEHLVELSCNGATGRVIRTVSS